MINYKEDKLMKTIKTLLLISVISFFMSFPFEVKAAEDCSEVKQLHKKIACKMKMSKKNKASASTGDAEGKAKSNKGKSWFKRLLEIGGENVGQEG